MSGEPGAMGGQPRPDAGEATNAEPMTPQSTDATVIPADAGAIPPGETAATVIPAPGPAAATTADPAIDAGVPVVTRRRRLVVIAAINRVLRFALMVALFAVGITIGYQAFLRSEPAPTGPTADPATAGNVPAPVVREFIAAVGRNDADAIRSAVPANPYKALTAEMSRWEIQQVTSVETLATYEDGQRTATAFVMIGRDRTQNPVAINLIVETEAGNIVGFK
jgi:hypothetical protein